MTTESELNLDDPVWDIISDECKDLLVGMLRKDPSERYNLKLIEKHPWFNDVMQEANSKQNAQMCNEDNN